ncbi:MAG: hypothetical protein D8M59_11960 [Planctomycetes bacterium]|nr:hypothetical protein [Planctomycetota bacterium]
MITPRHTARLLIPAALGAAVALTTPALAQSSNILVNGGSQLPAEYVSRLDSSGGASDLAASLHPFAPFTVIVQPPPAFAEHDHIQIIVRETSNIRSKQEVTTEKKWDLNGEVSDFPQLTINDLIEGILKASENASPPKLGVSSDRKFEGAGEYLRTDDFSARVMAEIIEILPNGHLVLEARTNIKQDDEVSTILLTGVADPRNITLSRTIQSSQLFDLRVQKEHEGELRETNKKGIIARVLESVFAF